MSNHVLDADWGFAGAQPQQVSTTFGAIEMQEGIDKIEYSNLLLSPSTLHTGFDGIDISHSFIQTLYAFMRPINEDQTPPDMDVFSLSVEAYARCLISASAHRIYIPAANQNYWTSPKQFRQYLKPTMKRKIIFLDQRDKIWKAIKNFFIPIIEDIRKSKDGNLSKFRDDIEDIAWDFYLLSLATRNQCQVTLDPIYVNRRISRLMGHSSFSMESRNRLAEIHGIFNLYTQSTDLPCLMCVPQQKVLFANRIDEILNDTDMLEISALRRFIGLRSNITSLKRDIKLIVDFIARNKHWAKGLITAAAQCCSLPTNSTKLIEKLFECIPLTTDTTAPVLFAPQRDYIGLMGLFCESYKDIFGHGQSWKGKVMSPELINQSTKNDDLPMRVWWGGRPNKSMEDDSG